MIISPDTKKLVSEISEDSERPIKNLFEVSAIIETSMVSGKQKEFKELIFSAKYINGLRNILSGNAAHNEDHRKYLNDEFNRNLQKMIDTLKNIISDSDEKINQYFSDKYFLLKHENMDNILGLIRDLSVCKKYFNENRVDLN